MAEILHGRDGLRLLLVDFFVGGRDRENDHVGKMNFHRHLVTYRPVHGSSLLQMNGCPGRKTQSVKNLATKEFAFLDYGQDSARF